MRCYISGAYAFNKFIWRALELIMNVGEAETSLSLWLSVNMKTNKHKKSENGEENQSQISS